MVTVLTGLILGYLNGYIHDAMSLGAMNDFAVPKNIAIGIGMWLGIVMWFNVWFVIWPNQKKALGIVEADADTKAARRARQCCSHEPTPCCRFRCCSLWFLHKTFTKAI